MIEHKRYIHDMNRRMWHMTTRMLKLRLNNYYYNAVHRYKHPEIEPAQRYKVDKVDLRSLMKDAHECPC